MSLQCDMCNNSHCILGVLIALLIFRYIICVLRVFILLRRYCPLVLLLTMLLGNELCTLSKHLLGLVRTDELLSVAVAFSLKLIMSVLTSL